MKQIFKAILFLFLTLNFTFTDEIGKDTITMQEQNLTRQVDELCEAIMDDDYNKVKAMLDENPVILNTTNSDGDRPILKLLYAYSMSKFNL